jgi:hypothetical protein
MRLGHVSLLAGLALALPCRAENALCKATITMLPDGDVKTFMADIKSTCKAGDILSLRVTNPTAFVVPYMCDFTKTVTAPLGQYGNVYCAYVGDK